MSKPCCGGVGQVDVIIIVVVDQHLTAANISSMAICLEIVMHKNGFLAV